MIAAAETSGLDAVRRHQKSDGELTGRGWRGASASVWLLVLVIAGYPLLGTLIAFTSLSSLVASVPVRAAVLGLSLSILWRTRTSTWQRPFNAILVAFFVLYFCRVVWDLYIGAVPVAGTFLLSFVFFSVPPALALMHCREFDEDKFLRILFPTCIITCSVALLAAYTNLSVGRSWTADNEGRLFLDTVNPITFGEIGVTTVLAAFAWGSARHRVGDFMLIIVAMVLGALTILLSASRGPFVSLVICLAVLGFRNRRFLWLVPVLAGATLLLVISDLGDSPVLLVARLASTVQEHSEVRMLVQADAVGQFLDHPLLGSSIVEQGSGDYPHNLIIEAGMATGLVGLVMYIPVLAGAAWMAVARLKSGQILVPLLAIQYMVAGQFSGSLSASVSIWVLIALLGAGSRAARHS